MCTNLVARFARKPHPLPTRPSRFASLAFSFACVNREAVNSLVYEFIQYSAREEILPS